MRQKRNLCLMILALFAVKVQAQQNDSLPVYVPGKVNNKRCVVYFTDSLYMTYDREDAGYFGYMYVDQGYCWDGLFCPRAENYRRKSKKYEASKPVGPKGSPVLLEGKFTWYNENGKPIMENNFVNGYPAIIEDHNYDAEGKVKSRNILDYTDRYQEQENSFRAIEYDGQGKKTSDLHYGKNKKGKWRMR